MTIKDYLSLIAGSLSVIMALIIIVISFKVKYRSRILGLRLTAFVLIILGALVTYSIFF
jgi:hypothetical protein